MCANNQFFLDLRQDEGRYWVCANVSIIDYGLAPYLTDLHKLTEKITYSNIYLHYVSNSEHLLLLIFSCHICICRFIKYSRTSIEALPPIAPESHRRVRGRRARARSLRRTRSCTPLGAPCRPVQSARRTPWPRRSTSACPPRAHS